MNTDSAKKPRFILHSDFRNLQLCLLTLFAGVLRFYHLSHPCLWFDESMVFWRTCSSYGQLLDCLRIDGFVPLHYSLVWVITRFVRPTPFVLRFVPALSGTLMVPAIYFLARQMLRHGTALLAAAFTACSAFMLFYSRDAKMYMDAWLFVTLNTACLLWWFRSGKSTAWLCWIASGCAACGLQITSSIPVAISVLLLLTQATVRWQRVLLWTLGVVVILAGPVGYYEKFNTWKDRVEEDWNKSDLQWIGAYNYGRTGPQLVRCLGSTTMMGWEWPKDLDVVAIPPDRFDWPARGAEALLGIMIVACLPWPRRWRPAWFFPVEATEIEPATNPGTATYKYLIPRTEPQWRIALWLALLIVIPVYGFYCRSMRNFATPLDWWDWLLLQFPFLTQPMAHHWMLIPIEIAVVAGIVGVAIYNQVQPAAIRAIQLLLVMATIVGLCQGIALEAQSLSKAATAAGKPWESIWVPRYIAFIWPALAIAIAALIMRLPTWPVRGITIVFLLGLNLSVAGYRIFGQTEPPVDLMAADVIDAENPLHRTLAWMHMPPGMQSPGSGNLYSGPGQYYLDMLAGNHTSPRKFRQSIRDRELEIPFTPTPWYQQLPTDLHRVIIWNQYDAKSGYTTAELPPPPEWKLQSEQWFDVRDCWIWRDLGKYRRRIYVRM